MIPINVATNRPGAAIGVTPVSTVTSTAGNTIKTGPDTAIIAVSPDGKTAYVTLGQSNEVVPFATATGSVGSPVKVGPSPGTIVFAP
ncbi:MAG TPA: hypothetical protein VGH27_08470 [Streptosporangiaceae bacterium]|jgi:YVTN family beta-propeller protein